MQPSTHTLRIALIVCWFCSTACGSTPTAPTPRMPAPPTAPFVGSWAGMIRDFTLGTGMARVELTTSDGRLRGTWSATIGSRTFTGTLSESPLSRGGAFILIDFGCSANERGGGSIVQNGPELTITYVAPDCDPLDIGQMTLRRE